MAAAVRDLKKWTTLSKADTRSHFAQELATMTCSIAAGDWDAFPNSELSQTTKPRSTVYGIVRQSRDVGVSLIPLALVYAVDRFVAKLPETISSYLYLGSIIWVAVGIISSLDPLYATKLEAFKTTLQLFPICKKRD